MAAYGGDPDVAFRLIRTLKRHYRSVILSVFGLCKSAGTLIALGADKIVMGEFGEFGPLDIQTVKADEMMSRSSGLDIFKAIGVLKSANYDSFLSYFFGIIGHSRGMITAKTAADIASQLSTGLFAPIMEKIEPLSIGEMQRKMNIAREYGKRLNSDENALDRLVNDYPSHGFAIDISEASEIFKDVGSASHADLELEKSLRSLHADLIDDPSSERAFSGFLLGLLPAHEENEENVNRDEKIRGSADHEDVQGGVQESQADDADSQRVSEQ